MADICLKRLRKEYRDIKKNPPALIRAAPLENNTLEWHYVLEGAKNTPYAGGWYHGVLLFPKDYPYKPPSVMMYTPNGRFREATRLCLSMSDFHPELWNTSWSVSTILVGLQSFMNEDTPTSGSISTSIRTKRQLARKTMFSNVKNKKFCTLFPELVEMHKEDTENVTTTTGDVGLEDDCGGGVNGGGGGGLSMESALSILVAILVCMGAIVLTAKTQL